jgi:hypothetical protein
MAAISGESISERKSQPSPNRPRRSAATPMTIARASQMMIAMSMVLGQREGARTVPNGEGRGHELVRRSTWSTDFGAGMIGAIVGLGGRHGTGSAAIYGFAYKETLSRIRAS